jgi:hypothetical protein
MMLSYLFQVKKKAVSLAAKIKREKGVSNGMAAFYKHLPEDFLEEKRRQRIGQPKITVGVGRPSLLLPTSVCNASFYLVWRSWAALMSCRMPS